LSFILLKDEPLYVNAYKYKEEDSSRIYKVKVNIKTGETVPVEELRKYYDI